MNLTICPKCLRVSYDDVTLKHPENIAGILLVSRDIFNQVKIDFTFCEKCKPPVISLQ